MYVELELAGNSEEFSRIGELDWSDYWLQNERVFNYTLARYFLMYLSAVFNAPRTR